VTTRIVILGAGFGGLELSARLSEVLFDEVRVTLIDQSDSFVFGFSKLDVMFGHRTMDQVALPYEDIAIPGVDFRRETITSIDPEHKRVTTDAGGTYEGDVLVLALGADLDPAATPGLLDGGHEFYSTGGAARLRDVLADFEGGAAVLAVLGPFFKCPPAPYETVFMLHDFLTRRDRRAASTIHLVTPMPKPIPISDEVSAALIDALEVRGIEHSHASWVTEYDRVSRRVRLKDGRELPCDLFLGVPVHRPPEVVVEAGLTEDDGWIAVDAATLATKFPDVYAIGDVASAPVPRAGVIAEGEARTVADVLVSRIRGSAAPPPFAGEVACFIEMGAGTVGRVNVDFLSGPNPTALFTPPSLDGAEEKRQFAATRRQRWFGHAR
jgi:sulfide:quinone oxidoreductase